MVYRIKKNPYRMNTTAAPTKSWRSRHSESQPHVAIDIKSAVAFPSLAKAATSHISAPPVMNYKASLEKVVPKATSILLVQTSQTSQKGRIYERRNYACEDTIIHVEEEEEYNAEIMSDRRRGDKGFW
jgi:hypothetical protein